MALWKGENLATTSQIAEYYGVTEKTIQTVTRRHKGELESDGLKVLRSKALKDATFTMKVASKTSQLTAFTPRAVLRLGMLLTGSDVAKSVRDVLLDLTTIIPQQQERLKELELELAIARSKENTEQLRLKANKSETELVNLKVGLKQTDPVTYQIVVEGKSLSETVPLISPSSIEIRTPDSESGVSVTQLMGELGCFERTKSGSFTSKDRELVKQLLLEVGVDLKHGDGASKVEKVVKQWAIPPGKVVDAKSRILAVVKDLRPNLYELAMNKKLMIGK